MQAKIGGIFAMVLLNLLAERTEADAKKRGAAYATPHHLNDAFRFALNLAEHAPYHHFRT